MSQILVRHGKGGKDRVTILPDNIREELQKHLIKVKALHESCVRKALKKAVRLAEIN